MDFVLSDYYVYLGQKTPKLIYDLSANYSNGALFEQTLKHLLFLLLGYFLAELSPSHDQQM